MFSVKQEIFGKDHRMVQLLEEAKTEAALSTSILIQGDDGIGKRCFAQWIHENSNRKAKEIVWVDCHDKAKSIENQVLGYRDEVTQKFHRGALERGNAGTVVFNHIDLLDENFQKRLFQIIQELTDYDLDVRLMATSSKNINKLVGQGKFLRGLYLQFANKTFQMIALKERPQDIPTIAQKILDVLTLSSNEQSIIKIGEEVKTMLMNHAFDKNISELKRSIEDAFESCEGDEILPQDIVLGDRGNFALTGEDEDEALKLMSLKDAEKLLIKKALIFTSENRTQAAKILGVSIRTLRNKINEYRHDGNHYFLNLR